MDRDEEFGDGVTSSSAPSASRQARHWHPARVVLAGATVVAMGLGVLVASGALARGEEETGAATPTAVADEPLPGPGMRLVGIGDVAVEVPETWGINKTHCGTPVADTVVVDEGAIGFCGAARPVDTTSIHLTPRRSRLEFQPDTQTDVDGATAAVESTTCGERFEGVLVCTSTLHFASRDIWVRAESSARSEAQARRDVEEAVSWIHILPDRVAVPGWRSLPFEEEQDDDPGDYLALLADLDLQANLIEEDHPGLPPGLVMGTSPHPGMVLKPGNTVTVRVVAPQDGLAERMAAGVSTSRAKEPEGIRSVTDAELRAGAQLAVAVGDTIWVTSNVEHKTLKVTSSVTGDVVLRKEEWTWDKWTASAPGQATITLFVEDGTDRERLGQVQVTVR